MEQINFTNFSNEFTTKIYNNLSTNIPDNTLEKITYANIEIVNRFLNISIYLIFFICTTILILECLHIFLNKKNSYTKMAIDLLFLSMAYIFGLFVSGLIYLHNNNIALHLFLDILLCINYFMGIYYYNRWRNE